MHSYTTERPHRSLDMATAVTLFRTREDAAPAASATAMPVAEEPIAAEQDSGYTPPGGGYEIGLRIPPSGVVDLVDAQQVWIGKSFAGTHGDPVARPHHRPRGRRCEVVTTAVSRLTTTDLDRLTMRGARTGQPAPALPAETRTPRRAPW